MDWNAPAAFEGGVNGNNNKMLACFKLLARMSARSPSTTTRATSKARGRQFKTEAAKCPGAKSFRL
eukprot:scaffold28009_cov19-Tisochrysis_lutea.AAC.1